MKKRDIYLILAILAAAGILWLCVSFLQKDRGAALTISMDGQVYGRYALDTDREIPIDDTNICHIEAGAVSMTWADCPDQVCVHSAKISQMGQTIICLPNRVVLEITDSSRTSPD